MGGEMTVDGKINFTMNLPDKCWRCAKDLTHPMLAILSEAATPLIIENGTIIARFYGYHWKCVPPNLFHKVAGSLPAGQSLGEQSFIMRHRMGTPLVPASVS